jgi:Fe-S cluster biogenesis protein NfuA
VTLKSGIENMLMHYIPEVKEVVEVSMTTGCDQGDRN